jgi:dTDP-4-dehydrorhamnose reductase
MTIQGSNVLLIGGSGRLGTELQRLIPGIVAPCSSELDITYPEAVPAALDRYNPAVLVHAAAYTNVRAAEEGRSDCWKVNVEGTRNVVRAVLGRPIFLVFISTDYVFEGSSGMYKEEDPVGPVRNYYALSKLVGEELVRLATQYLIVRTSFRPRDWPYPVAFSDVYTSQDYVDVIAPEVALAITQCDEVPFNTIHIATQRKSVYELARSRSSDVREGSKRETAVALPDDISLDISRWEEWKQMWKGR